MLKFERLDGKLIVGESSRNKQDAEMHNSHASQSNSPSAQSQHHNLHHHHSTNVPFNKKKKTNSRYPKYELVASFNVVFDFIFDKNITSPEQVTRMLNVKRSLAIFTAKNLDLATKFLESILGKEFASSEPQTSQKLKFNLEYLLVFLSSFFTSSSSNLLHSSSSYNSRASQSPSSANNSAHPVAASTNKSGSSSRGAFSFPPTLQFGTVHYLQNLYACGIATERQVQKAYFSFVSLLLDYANSIKSPQTNATKNDTLVENLIIRYDCFLVSFLDIDWETSDLRFVRDANVIGYLIKNASKCMPIDFYKSDAGLTPSQVLEDIFRLSREKFNESLCSGTACKSSEFQSPNSKLSVVEEESSFTKEEDTIEAKFKPENVKSSESSSTK